MPKQFLDPQGLSQFTENLEQSIVADKYSSSTAYAVGDYCVYENLLYRCTTAIPSGESWNSSHWVQILIMGDLKSKTQIRNVTTAEYEALSPEEKATGDFVITDPEMYPLTANTVPYDNSQSGSSATNVQAALDSVLDFEHTKSGSLVSFDNGGNNIPVKSLIVKITAQQGGSGTPSPSNVRPIYGYDSADIHVDGLNIFDKSLIERDHNLIWADGSLGTETGSWTSNYILVKPGTTYRANKTLGELFAYDINKTTVYVWKGGWLDVGVTGTDCGIAFTIPEGISYIRFARRNSVIGGNIDADVANFQLEIGSEITAYNSYKGTTYTIALGSTIYGGTLDVTKGVLIITHGYKSYSGGFSQASNGVFYIDGTISDADTSSYSIVCLSNRYGYAGVKSATSGMVGQEDKFGVQFLQGLRIMVCDTSFADDTAFNNSLLSTPLQVVYPLATPVVINLTKTQVTTLLNENNIYANSGDISVEYFTQSAKNMSDVANSSNKMDFSNPTGTGSLSIDRKPGTTIGTNSVAVGYYNEASGSYGSFASGFRTAAIGEASHVSGAGTIAKNSSQNVFGRYNIQDPSSSSPTNRGTYIEIVGNGTNNANRSNARTLDWNGNEVLAGGLKLHDNQNAATLIVSNDIAANGGTLDCSVFPDGSIIFLYRNVDETQGIYIKSSSRWSKVIPVLPLSYVSTNGYVITNNNTNYLLRSSVIAV